MEILCLQVILYQLLKLIWLKAGLKMEHLITNFKQIDMKRFKTIFAMALVFPLFAIAQEDNDTIVKSEVKLERAAFESTALIDNQTNVLNTKGTLEMVLNHRFGLVGDDNSLLGLWSPSNIRIALSLSLIHISEPTRRTP